MNTDCWGLQTWKGWDSRLEPHIPSVPWRFQETFPVLSEGWDVLLRWTRSSLHVETEDLTDVWNMASPAQRSSSEHLQVLSWLVLRLRGGEVVLQEALQVLKRGPLLRLFPPTGQHQVVQRFGALCRTGHPVAPLHLVQHLPVHHPCESETGTKLNVKSFHQLSSLRLHVPEDEELATQMIC